MGLFLFLLLMLATAWGLADHYQSLIDKTPPQPPPPRISAPPAKPVTTTETPPSAASENEKPQDIQQLADDKTEQK
jgi:hypothetical protein